MAQPILKRRLNPLLLISTVAALSLLAGVAVLAQDQMASVQNEKSDIQQKLQETRDTVDRLRAEIANKTARIRQMNGNISRLEKKLNNSRSELDNKTEKIKELESQLSEQRQALNQSDTIRKLNNSLRFVCYLEQTEGSIQPESVEECRKWDIQVNNSEG